MHLVTVTTDIDAPAGKVWAVAGDFGGLKAWSRAVQDCRVEGSGVGSERIITMASGAIRERLEECDAAAMRLAYSVVSGSSLPIEGMRATIQLTSLAEGGTRVAWRIDGEPRGDAVQVAAALQARYAGRLEELRVATEAGAVSENKDVSVDVVVLGAGLAGLCAALAAAEAGASVLLVEKTPKAGGSTLMSAGSFALAGTDLQAAAGVKDSPEGLEAELHKVAGGKADPGLVRAYVEQQAAAYEWLKRQGVVFHKVSLSSSTAVPRTHPTDPRQLVEALQARVKDTPSIESMTQVAATRLLTNPGTKEVTGVECSRNGRTLQVHARRGVVLATGGFTRNRELVQKFAPELANAPAWGGEGNTGDGLVMAWELGADLLDMGYVTGTFGVAINHYPDLEVREGDELLLRMAMYRGAIAVNLDGKRFADESQSYKALATRCLAQPRAIAFQVFDQSVMAQSAPAPTVNDLEGALRKGVVRRADSLVELAQLVGLDPQALESTVARYNAMVLAGEDLDFGRKTLGGGFGVPVPLETPPWYILPCSAALLSTYCGLRVDTAMRVQDVRRRAIPRLHAAGEVVGGFHGAGYMSGSSLGKAVIFGRIAGRSAAAA